MSLEKMEFGYNLLEVTDSLQEDIHTFTTPVTSITAVTVVSNQYQSWQY